MAKAEPQREMRSRAWRQHPILHGVLGLVAALLLYLIVPGDEHPQAPLVAAVVGIMAVWWVFEVIPIAVTSLFPLFLFPAFSVSDMRTVGAFYGRPIIFLFLGGFLLALGLQESGVHKRFALHIVRRVGGNPARLTLGFMIASGLMSMWISNTASVMVMLPIALSVIDKAKDRRVSPRELGRFSACLMLGIAYAADIGGMATPIGTPPNLVFLEMYEQLFPAAPRIGFLHWLIMGLPLTFLFMTGGWLLLTKVTFRLPPEQLFEGQAVIERQLAELGRMRRDERMAALVFALAAALWVTGSDLRLGAAFTVFGWRSLLGLEEVSDAAVAVACAVLLFAIPSRDRPGERLLQWESARQVPWGILLLFGGGLAMAGAFETSGLSTVVGEVFANLSVESPTLVVLTICTIITFLTELTSNTAMTNLVLPILAKASVSLGLDPRVLMIPATLSASCAFMMPIASPTQAIVFGSGYVPIRQMIRAGIWFNMLGVVLVTAVFMTVGHLVLGLNLSELPAWAPAAAN